MTCINLGELSEYEAKLKFYMMSYMREMYESSMLIMIMRKK